MTNKERFELIKATMADNEDIVTFCDKNIAALSRKRAKSSTPTKRQIENEAVKAKIAEVLSAEGQTVTQILHAIGDDTLTNQRVSALLRQMGVEKQVVKGKALFFA